MNEKTNQEKRETREWVFIPLLKKHILKRTDTYILFDVDGVASGIISAKFLRKKETEDFIFLSVPADYEVNCNVRDFVDGSWKTINTYKVPAVNLVDLIKSYNKLK